MDDKKLKALAAELAKGLNQFSLMLARLLLTRRLIRN